MNDEAKCCDCANDPRHVPGHPPGHPFCRYAGRHSRPVARPVPTDDDRERAKKACTHGTFKNRAERRRVERLTAGLIAAERQSQHGKAN